SFIFGVLILPLALTSIQAQPSPPDPGTAIVSGVVVLKGQPLCGVFINLVDQRDRQFNRHHTTTDENGRFRIMSVAAGKYWLSAQAPGHILPGSSYDITGKSGWPLDVVDGQKIENIVLEIKRGSVITGRITDSRGAPMTGEVIQLRKFDKS